ncbi:MAG TPA: hypothetical protein VN857_16545 [Chthoniobacterales bacterium]|nr:hypothetical protein [Chthoniobacterales bacterium]
MSNDKWFWQPPDGEVLFAGVKLPTEEVNYRLCTILGLRYELDDPNCVAT